MSDHTELNSRVAKLHENLKAWEFELATNRHGFKDVAAKVIADIKHEIALLESEK